jgi:Ca2+-binding EF-hand superfamily protein
MTLAAQLTEPLKRLPHESIFKAIDSDKDGTVSQEEMLDFMRGTIKSSPQH